MESHSALTQLGESGSGGRGGGGGVGESRIPPTCTVDAGRNVSGGAGGGAVDLRLSMSPTLR